MVGGHVFTRCLLPARLAIPSLAECGRSVSMQMTGRGSAASLGLKPPQYATSSRPRQNATYAPPINCPPATAMQQHASRTQCTYATSALCLRCTTTSNHLRLGLLLGLGGIASSRLLLGEHTPSGRRALGGAKCTLAVSRRRLCSRAVGRGQHVSHTQQPCFSVQCPSSSLKNW